MKRIILTITGTLAVCVAGAQEKWTLQQCIERAEANNIELQQTAISVASAEIDLNTTRNSRLPNLSAGVSDRISWGLEADYQTNLKEVSTRSSTSADLSTSVPIFAGFRINNQIKQDRLNLEAAMEGLDAARENLALQVTQYFLDVLLKKEVLYVYEEQLVLSQKQLAQTEEMVTTGKVAESQLFDMRSQVAANEVSKINAQNDLSLSLLNLSQVLNLEAPMRDVVEPDIDNIMAQNHASLLSPDEVYTTALDVKPVVRQAEYQLGAGEYQVKIAKSAYYPNISLGGSVGDGYVYKFGETGQESFATQFRNGYSVGVGLNLSIPIFNRMQTRNNVRKARLSVNDYQLRLDNVKLALYKQIQQAYQGAVSAEARFVASEKAVQAATEAFRAMQLRYEYGKATPYEYNEVQTKLISSTSQQLQAKYDYVFSTKILDFYRGVPIEIE
jgi:outer membrane protein